MITWIKELRHREMELVANAEASYAKMVEAWREKPPRPKNLRKGLFNNIRVQIQNAVIQIGPRLGQPGERILDRLGQRRLAGDFVQLGLSHVSRSSKIGLAYSCRRATRCRGDLNRARFSTS